MEPEAEIGVICMDTDFTKIPGHIRNTRTFDFPVRYHVVTGATAERVVTQADPTLLEPFIRAAQKLEADGVAAVTSACGFLAIFQQDLADSVDVPVYASSLIQLPMVSRMMRRSHKVGGLPADEHQQDFREVVPEARRPDLDADRLEREVLGVVDRLATEHADLGALVIECTDLVPFAHAIQARLGLPVFSIVT